MIDLEREVSKALGYLCDEYHYTEEGAELVANIVSRGLEPVNRQASRLANSAELPSRMGLGMPPCSRRLSSQLRPKICP